MKKALPIIIVLILAAAALVAVQFTDRDCERATGSVRAKFASFLESPSAVTDGVGVNWMPAGCTVTKDQSWWFVAPWGGIVSWKTFTPEETTPSDDVQPSVEAVTDFESCAAAGNPVMESYPRQCRANGQTFVEDVSIPPVTGEPGSSEPGSPGTEEELPGGGEVFVPPEVANGITRSACEAAGGTFNECGSACRGAAPGTACIMMCVMYCECASSSQCPSGYACGDFVEGVGVCKE